MSEEKRDRITVREFKAMIAGMDLVNGEEWAPDATAWKRIREKIDALAEEPDPAPTAAPARTRRVANLDNPWENGNVTVPASNEGVPPGPTTMGAGTSALTPPAPAAPVQTLSNGEQGVKTPDIDSSGGYDSPFA